MKNIKRIVFILLVMSSLLFAVGNILFINDTNKYERVKQRINKVENKHNISKNDISKIEKEVSKLDKIYQKDFETNIKDLKYYYNTKEMIDNHYKNGIVLSTTTTDDITKIKNNYKNLKKPYKSRLKNKINLLQTELTNINNIKFKIDDIFIDNTIKENINFTTVDQYEKELKKLPQKDIVTTYIAKITTARKLLKEREKKRVEAAWVKLNVPYISQNLNKVYNGCEAAALMMCMQYKGLLKDMNYLDFVKQMPMAKSNNAFEGFTHDIYGLEPRDVPHWIAPAPLAKFGRDISGYNNIVDGTGLSIDELDAELEKGNPIVIYATGDFKEPQEVIEGVPKNIHVMALTGYNKLTKEQFITDPWQRKSGQRTWTISKELLESRNNALGKKSVIVK